MTFFQKLVKFCTDKKYRFNILASRGFYNHWSDEKFLKRKFKLTFGYDLNLKNPQTFNEKLQWLKLHDRNPLYTTMVDKYAVKKWVANKIGEQYIIPTLGVWKSFDEINFDKLPNQFVLKTTHDSGGIVICKDKNIFDKKKARTKLAQSLTRNYYYHGREWPYQKVLPCIIAEKYMVDESGYDLKDYKVLCFNGEPKLIEFHRNRFTQNHIQEFYDTSWHKTSISQTGIANFRISKDIFPRPTSLDEMLHQSRMLAQHLIHARIDWYCINEKLYFGEITFFDGSGFEPFDNFKDDLLLGNWIKLPQKSK